MRISAVVVLVCLAACSPSESPGPAPSQQVQGEGAAAGPQVPSAPPSRLEAYRLTGPRSRANLAIYLIHEKNAPAGDRNCLVLEEAVQSGALKITEKGEGAEVNELQIENAGDKPVYLQAGDTVKGGQQDRTIAVDFILPPKSGKRTVDAFCVEPGRWSVRNDSGTAALASPSSGGGAALSVPSTGATFALAADPTPVASKEQKLAVRLSKSQEKVWEAGKQVNEDLAARARTKGPAAPALDEPKNSYVEAVEDPAVAKKVDEIVAAFLKLVDDQPEAIGAAFCVNGKLQNVEIYSGTGLFRKLWPKLLRAAAVEAFSKAEEAVPPAPPTESEVRKLLGEFSGKGGRAELRPAGPVVRIFEQEHAVLFDTEHQGKLLHRQLLTK